MYRCKIWTIKKAERWRIDAFQLWCWRRLLRSLGLKKIKQVNPKRNQLWIFIGRTDAEAETPILWATWCEELTLLKRLWSWERLKVEEKGTTEDEMVRWHHRLNGHEFEWTPGVGDGQGGLTCCSPWGCKESVMTEQLNWTELNRYNHPFSRTLFQLRGESSSPFCFFTPFLWKASPFFWSVRRESSK